jgi:hypothetical protein
MSKHETMGSSLRAMAARCDAMEKEMAKLEQLSAYYSMMVVSLQKVTTALSDAYESTDAGEAYAGDDIREAAAILREAAPPLKEWAEAMLTQWKSAAMSPRKRRGRK